jgi:hypothetical protein
VTPSWRVASALIIAAIVAGIWLGIQVFALLTGALPPAA